MSSAAEIQSDNAETEEHDHGREGGHKSRFWGLVLGCIGVVYGDIGTSPLYAFREAMKTVADGGTHPYEVYGILSLLIWALFVIVTLKYIAFVLRADNRGEGGVLSLMALAQKTVGRKSGAIFMAAIAGAALFYGDAAITPAISVLSAVEGLELAVPHFEPYVLPIAIFLLIALFMFQRFGTRRVSILFGPVMILWFLTLATAGVSWIVQNPTVLRSFNPYYGVEFLIQHSGISLIVLGSVFLTVTGAEALYADLGHFGRKPIQTAWIMLIFPALTLNYLGQGALLLAKPEAIENPFFLLVPEWGLIPLICLATLATIIASQANITGAFSMTRQAIQLGLLPRMEIRHMSAMHEGQIYMPKVNGFLLFAVLLLCLVFRNSSALASAYGIAVNGTMLVTSIVFMIVVSRVWKKGPVLAALIVLPFISLEIVFMTANLMKLFDGGYVPLLFAAFNVLLMVTWVSGSRYLFRKARRHSISLADLVSILDNDPPHIIKGTAVFLTSDPQTAPEALMQNLKHNQVLHERNFILTVNTVPTPRVAEDQRLMIEVMSSRMTRIIANFGYMETPDVTRSLYQARWHGFDIDVEHVSFFLGRRNIISDPRRGLPGWQDKIYIALARSAVAATDFYRIPRSQVVELGIQMSV